MIAPTEQVKMATSRNWTADPVLTVEHLTMRFGGLTAIDNLSFEVGRGDITALIGPNGAGKTTVFNCVTGFYKPTEGRITLRRGRDIPARAVEELTRSGRQSLKVDKGELFLLERMADFRITHTAGVARTFQNIRLFGGMTVFENLLVAQHNKLMVASGYTFAGLVGLPSYHRARERRRIWQWTGCAARRSWTVPTIRRPICPMVTSAAWRSPAPCAPTRRFCAWTSPPPA